MPQNSGAFYWFSSYISLVINQELLQELKVIIAEEYNLELSDDEISQLGNSLVNCFQILTEQEEKEHD